MGAVRDIVNGADNTAGITNEIKETLGLLMSLAKAKGEAFTEKINASLKTGKLTDDLNVAVTKVIKRHIEYRAVTQTGTSVIVDEIQRSLGDLFSGEAKILSGIAGIVNAGLTAIMGEGEGQESEVTTYAVVAEYPAIVRYDFAFWGRNIRAQSIKNYMENAFTCVAFKSAVDVSKLAFNDFLSLYGPILRAAYGTDATKLKEMIEQARDIYALFNVKQKMLPSDVAVNALLEAPTKPLFTMTTRLATEGNF